MQYARVKSYAKINLTLDVLNSVGGYHMIDSLVASVDIADLITATRRKDGLINVYMHGEGSENIPPERNNAITAAERYKERFRTNGADINIYKNIPIGAGLGGSSADISGVIKVLSKLYPVENAEELKTLADSLGSDTGYMLSGGWARLGGRGERVTPIETGCKLYIALLIPSGGVSTAECYKMSDGLAKVPHTTQKAAEYIANNDICGLCNSLLNGLFPAAKQLNPDVGEAISELKAFSPMAVNMTGSGSGVYAVFENDEFLRYFKSRYRGKHRVVLTSTVTPKTT